MNKEPGDVLYPGSLVLLLFFTTVEGDVVFGSSLFKAAGRDAWLSVIIGALATYPLLFLMLKLALRFPRQTFFEYVPKVWGRFLGYPIILVFTGCWLLWLVKIVWQAGDVNTTYFLTNTPQIIVYILFILGAVYLAKYGLVPIARFCDLMFLFFFVPWLFSHFIALTNSHLGYFLPFLANGILPVLKGSLIYLGMVQGIEIILFALPFVSNPRKAIVPAFAGLSILHLSMLISTLATQGTIGSLSAAQNIYTSMEMLNSLHVSGWPVERFELFLTMPWFIGVFTSMVLAVYLIAYGASRLIPLQRWSLFCWGSGILGVALTYLIPDVFWSDTLWRFIQILYIGGLFPLVMTTLLLSVIRKQREGDTG